MTVIPVFRQGGIPRSQIWQWLPFDEREPLPYLL